MMEFVNGKDDIPYIMEKNKYLKPPTRHIYIQVEEAEIGLSGKKRGHLPIPGHDWG